MRTTETSRLPHHDGLRPRAVSQNKHFLPEVAFLGYFVTAVIKATKIHDVPTALSASSPAPQHFRGHPLGGREWGSQKTG